MSAQLRTIVLVVAALFAKTAVAEDAYYDVPVGQLKLTLGSLPVRSKTVNWRQYELAVCMRPYAVLDGQGETYVDGEGRLVDRWNWPSAPGLETARLVVCSPRGKNVTGRLVVPNSDLTGMVVLRFEVPASAARAKAKTAFLRGKLAYYESLLRRDVPGGAWFRHRARLTRTALHLPVGAQPGPANRAFTGRGDELTRTYDLFTGGRAMSENLQLNRALPRRARTKRPSRLTRSRESRSTRSIGNRSLRMLRRSSTRWLRTFPRTSTWSSFRVSRPRLPSPTRPNSTTPRCCVWPSRGRKTRGSSNAIRSRSG